MNKTTVLIVEDDKKFLRSMKALVSGEGFHGGVAKNFKDALGFLEKKNKKVIVVADINLNGESGLDLLAKIGMLYPHIPVIIVTGYASLESSIRALRLGAYDYFSKPFEPEMLIHAVRRAHEKIVSDEERKKAERKLKKVVRELERKNLEVEKLSLFKTFMMSMASHDLKTLLTVLNGYYKVFEEQMGGKCSEDELTMIQEGGICLKRALMMIESLLDYHSVETGTINIQNTRFAIEEVIDESLDFLRAFGEMKDISLKKEMGRGKLCVYADRLKVAQIVDNLVTNSIKFTSTGGIITIRVDQEGEKFLKISVSDNGCGIPTEKIKGILSKDPEIFQREGTGSVGLGLSICKRLVEVQKGTLDISTNPGIGTEVSFTLPSTTGH